MKIVCDNCATKYSIADEKVSGKAFKLRCKKCSHVIVVKGPSDGDVAQAGNATSAASAPASSASQEAAPAPEAAIPPGGEAVWHLVIDREQVGPMTAEEVRGKFAAGQVDAETYIWREGFDDWLKVGAVPDFKDLAPADAGTVRADPATLFQPQSPVEEPPANGLFPSGGEGAYQPQYTATPNAQTMMGGTGGVSGYDEPVTSRPRQSDYPATDVVSAPDSPGGMEVASMKGARSENSVLFSLNNLQALAMGGSGGGGGGAGGAGGGGGSASAPTPSARPGFADVKSEASGLIDIRAMAAQTLSANSFSPGMPSSKPDELPMINEAPLFSPVAPAMLMPTAEPQGMPKWVWGVIAGGGALFIGMIVVLVVALRPPAPTPTPTATPTPVGTTPIAVATAVPGQTPPTAGNPGAGTGGGDVAARPGEANPPPAGEDKRPKRPKSDKGERTAKPGKEPVAAVTPPPVAPTRVDTPPPAPVKVKPAKPKDDLDALLESASPGGAKIKGETAKKDAPEQLSMDTIKGVLKGVGNSAASCKQPGTYMVNLTIGKNGRVSNAAVPGKAGDPGADCVVKAVKAAKFPEFTGDPQSLTYPFILR